jgi:hypothetical protein
MFHLIEATNIIEEIVAAVTIREFVAKNVF